MDLTGLCVLILQPFDISFTEVIEYGSVWSTYAGWRAGIVLIRHGGHGEGTDFSFRGEDGGVSFKADIQPAYPLFCLDWL